MPKRQASSRLPDLPPLLRLGMVVAAFAPLVAVGIYTWHFNGRPLSPNPSEWGQFGDFLGGALGWVLSLVTLTAVYATYLKQRESDTAQREHASKSILLLQQQNDLLSTQLAHATRDGFDNKLAGLIRQLVHSVLVCRRESERA